MKSVSWAKKFEIFRNKWSFFEVVAGLQRGYGHCFVLKHFTITLLMVFSITVAYNKSWTLVKKTDLAYYT